MNLRTRIAAAGAAAAMVSILGLAGTAASAAPSGRASTIAAAPTAGLLAVAPHAVAPRSAASLPVTGLLPGGKKFTGQLSHLKVSMVKGVPMLSGLLKGTGLPAAGVPFKTPLKSAQAACKVLNLNIQPINLDLLGLVVDLDAVHLAVKAVPGAGLLGNLLCALTNVANPGGASAPGAVPTQIIAPILSQVLSLLHLGAPAVG